MHRITFSLPDELHEDLRKSAASEGISIAEAIRRAIKKNGRSPRPKPKSIGIGYSGYKDTARRIGEEGFEPQPWR